MDESRRERRARQRWEREMMRRLEELDDLDRRYGLGVSGRASRRGSRVAPAAPRHAARRAAPTPDGEPCPAGSAGRVLPAPVRVLQEPDHDRRAAAAVRRRARRQRRVVRVRGQGHQRAAGRAGTPASRSLRGQPRGAPDSWEEIVDDAMSGVEEASGFDFESDGKSDDRSADRSESDAREELPVLIGWATPDEVPSLQGDTVGIGGSSAVTPTARPGSSPGWWSSTSRSTTRCSGSVRTARRP